MKKVWIQLNYFGLFKAKLSRGSDYFLLPQGANLKDLLLLLVSEHGDKLTSHVFNSLLTDVRSDVIVTINDLPHRQLQGLETSLKDDDKINLMPMFIGGG